MACYFSTRGKLMSYYGSHKHSIENDISILCGTNKSYTTFHVTISGDKLIISIKNINRFNYDGDNLAYIYEYDLDGIINVKYDSKGVFVIYTNKIIYFKPTPITYYTEEPLTPNTQVVKVGCGGIAVLHNNGIIYYGINKVCDQVLITNNNYVLLKINGTYELVFNNNGVITCRLNILSFQNLSNKIYVITFCDKKNRHILSILMLRNM